MKKATNRFASVCLFAALCMVLECYSTSLGAANNQKKADFGTIGVVGYQYIPKVDVDISNLGKGFGTATGAAEGAAYGALEGLVLTGDCLGCIILLPIFVAAGLVIGAIHGLATSDSAEQSSLCAYEAFVKANTKHNGMANFIIFMYVNPSQF